MDSRTAPSTNGTANGATKGTKGRLRVIIAGGSLAGQILAYALLPQ